MTGTETPSRGYRIAEVARRSGFSETTLRYYEQAGVLAAPERTPGGYRLYQDRDLERLRLIARAKDLGCTLAEIAELVQAWDGDECGPVKHRLRALVRAKVARADAHLAEQAAFADQLRAADHALAGRPLDGPCDDSCGCTTTTGPAGASTTCGAGGHPEAGAGPAAPLPGPGGSVDRSAEPIACSLSGPAAEARTVAWHQLLDGTTIRRPLPGGIRLELGRRTRIEDLAALVDAEQACCPFFAFAITVDGRGLALEVTAPADAQTVLASVFGAPA